MGISIESTVSFFNRLCSLPVFQNFHFEETLHLKFGMCIEDMKDGCRMKSWVQISSLS